jgi:hypothetical protein
MSDKLEPLPRGRRESWCREILEVHGLLLDSIARPKLDTHETLRLVGSGMTMLLGLAVELLGGDPEGAAPEEAPGQLHLFDPEQLSP